MRIWTNLNSVIDSGSNTIVAGFRTTEKTVGLIENEVDHLAAQQAVRIETERQALAKLTSEVA